MIQNKKQTFNDGIVKVYAVDDQDRLTLKETLRFHRRTVGIKRYYTAMQVSQKVDAVLRCPFRDSVAALDMALIGDVQYRIDFVQYPEDAAPPVMDLTLQKIGAFYDMEVPNESTT
ncbi:hypothetical protein RWV98_02955 [Agathobaculum sp. NTUH-O15-33]|uniref:hypothetical protein n=1 Tax=Agathobaculum sp. NTUH-O15-33 TaxID=3079302 RepID=UPI0029587A81|nr:hypothetical protein [Agathobaculum sp. NTUH-O15-33]WNX85251.1 hypothetical protein RWV98_02955 [Agathobaculum sp. NTUH-O15-33]